MNATEMKCHPYLLSMSCPVGKRMGRADELTGKSLINMKNIVRTVIALISRAENIDITSIGA